tara:strand:+ start:518 stop:691 length:174 start_codon:yes stop_codon:yes gene_type:complete
MKKIANYCIFIVLLLGIISAGCSSLKSTTGNKNHKPHTKNHLPPDTASNSYSKKRNS